MFLYGIDRGVLDNKANVALHVGDRSHRAKMRNKSDGKDVLELEEDVSCTAKQRFKSGVGAGAATGILGEPPTTHPLQIKVDFKKFPPPPRCPCAAFPARVR